MNGTGISVTGKTPGRCHALDYYLAASYKCYVRFMLWSNCALYLASTDHSTGQYYPSHTSVLPFDLSTYNGLNI